MTGSDGAQYALQVADSNPAFPPHFKSVEAAGSAAPSGDRGPGGGS
jgi:hypothetical protein